MTAQADLRWVGAAPQMVFEDAHLRVMFQPGGSDMLLLTFGDAAVLADGTRFFADTVASKFGINCLGFMARAPNWYPASSMRAAARAVAYTLAAFGIRIFYGSSMGAYAAVKYSALLGATHVLTLCPQWSIDPAECGGNESGYRDFFRPEMAGMGVTGADMAGEITVFYDPGQRDDAYHYRMLEALSPCAPAVCIMRDLAIRGSAAGLGIVQEGSATPDAVTQDGAPYATTPLCKLWSLSSRQV